MNAHPNAPVELRRASSNRSAGASSSKRATANAIAAELFGKRLTVRLRRRRAAHAVDRRGSDRRHARRSSSVAARRTLFPRTDSRGRTEPLAANLSLLAVIIAPEAATRSVHGRSLSGRRCATQASRRRHRQQVRSRRRIHAAVPGAGRGVSARRLSGARRSRRCDRRRSSRCARCSQPCRRCWSDNPASASRR